MAKGNKAVRDEDQERNADLSVVDGGADTSDDADWTSDEVPRMSIGEGTDKQGRPRVAEITGRYLYSIRQRIKRRMTTLHRFTGKAPGMAEAGEFLVYGSGAINNKIALIPPGTRLKLLYKGEKDVGQDTPMKDIQVLWPKGTRLLSKPNVVPLAEREAGEDDDQGDDE